MNVNFDTSVSGMQAFGTRQAVQANNVANVNTDGFQASRGLMREQLPSGVRTSISRDTTQGPVRVEQTASGPQQVEMSNTDLNTEMPATLVNERSYQANATMIRTQDEMLGTLLDITA